ncbi:tyrosine-type recombinase/integrase [Noviherbaspirillum aerium]|uniref:tyrosine-type recombinase/integrase n=1 Tax=Noviherbaspirillum aerium TaxID=2588497 RepID=UPI00124C640C|nr:site-specific integrase [Noviherbaspirillum aerium]
MNRQLYSLSGSQFVSYLRTMETGQPCDAANESLTFVMWPNGSWCIEVNLFLEWLYAQGYSIKGRGGTLATYAAYLTPLIRYCANNNKGFIQLIDADFALAVSGLKAEKTYRKGELVNARNATQVEKIGVVWLEFLNFVGEQYYDDPFFVGRNLRIKGYKTEYKRRSPRGNIIIGTKWTHPSFPLAEPDKIRLPTTDEQLTLLRGATDQLGKSDFLRLRRLAMLELFESLGLRRMELILLRTSDVRRVLEERRKALTNGVEDYIPQLRFRTVKSRNSTYKQREVPIDEITLNFLESYGKARKRYLETLGIKDDKEHGLFIINCKNGKGLVPNTITQEFSVLAKTAKISVQCCPHMMRHRFITKSFVRLILAHELEQKDDFRKMLLSAEAFKKKVMEITGHISEESLNVYINLAFEEVAELKKTMNRVQAQTCLDALKAANDRYLADISRGYSSAEAGHRLSQDVDAAMAAAKRYLRS